MEETPPPPGPAPPGQSGSFAAPREVGADAAARRDRFGRLPGGPQEEPSPQSFTFSPTTSNMDDLRRMPLESPVSRVVGRFRREAEEKNRAAMEAQIELDNVRSTQWPPSTRL